MPQPPREGQEGSQGDGDLVPDEGEAAVHAGDHERQPPAPDVDGYLRDGEEVQGTHQPEDAAEGVAELGPQVHRVRLRQRESVRLVGGV